jgi:ferrous iron transport protein A
MSPPGPIGRMTDIAITAALPAAAAVAGGTVSLGQARAGQAGVIVSVSAAPSSTVGGVDCAELERRLLEAGFVEGARVTLLHEGPLGGDPIAVRLDDMRVALRRREAHGVLVQLDPSS